MTQCYCVCPAKPPGGIPADKASLKDIAKKLVGTMLPVITFHYVSNHNYSCKMFFVEIRVLKSNQIYLECRDFECFTFLYLMIYFFLSSDDEMPQ